MKRKAPPKKKTPPPKKKKKQKKLTPPGKQKVVTAAATQLRPKSARIQSKHDVNIKPHVIFTSRYVGVSTQKLGVEQAMGFDQTATLSLAGTTAPHDLSHYYEFRQEVRDAYTDQAGIVQPLTAWAQDLNYQPNYTNAQTLAGKTTIVFTDQPGFSTDRKIDIGEWLISYEVYFRWKVKDKFTNDVWISPAVHHSIACAYNAGNDRPITKAAHGDENWEATTLPARPAI